MTSTLLVVSVSYEKVIRIKFSELLNFWDNTLAANGDDDHDVAYIRTRGSKKFDRIGRLSIYRRA